MMDGHTLSAVYGPDMEKWATCECGTRLEGPTADAVTAAHAAHVGRLLAQPGLARARQSLADTIARRDR